MWPAMKICKRKSQTGMAAWESWFVGKAQRQDILDRKVTNA